MKPCLRAVRLIIRSTLLLIFCVISARMYAQMLANPAANGALAYIATPNISASLDALQGVPSESRSTRSLLRRQSGTSSSISGLSQQRRAALYATAARASVAGSTTNSSSKSFYGTASVPTISPLRFKSGAGRSLGMGLSSGFSTRTLLGSRSVSGFSASSGSLGSWSNSSRKLPSIGSSSSLLRSTLVPRSRSKQRFGGLSQKYKFQPPRSRYDKTLPENSLRSRLLANQQ